MPRSAMMRDFKHQFGNSITTAPAIPKSADDFHDEQEVENNLN